MYCVVLAYIQLVSFVGWIEKWNGQIIYTFNENNVQDNVSILRCARFSLTILFATSLHIDIKFHALKSVSPMPWHASSAATATAPSESLPASKNNTNIKFRSNKKFLKFSTLLLFEALFNLNVYLEWKRKREKKLCSFQWNEEALQWDFIEAQCGLEMLVFIDTHPLIVCEEKRLFWENVNSETFHFYRMREKVAKRKKKL